MEWQLHADYVITSWSHYVCSWVLTRERKRTVQAVIDARNNFGDYWHYQWCRWRCGEVEARRGLQLAWVREEVVSWMAKERCCASHDWKGEWKPLEALCMRILLVIGHIFGLLVGPPHLLHTFNDYLLHLTHYSCTPIFLFSTFILFN